ARSRCGRARSTCWACRRRRRSSTPDTSDLGEVRLQLVESFEQLLGEGFTEAVVVSADLRNRRLPTVGVDGEQLFEVVVADLEASGVEVVVGRQGAGRRLARA